MSPDGRDGDVTVASHIASGRKGLVQGNDAASAALFSPLDNSTRITAWDKWCETDYVRNDIVIPHLKRLITGRIPCTISDVGCGSGYITRRLAQASSGMHLHWVLVDSNRAALAYAHDSMAMLAHVDSFHADLTRQLRGIDIPPADLAFMAFTLLELQRPEREVGDCIAVLDFRKAWSEGQP
jgi:SAM-dependent methyltransferase